MKIYLDFDGTVVEHEYPKIGRCNYGCFEVIKKLQDAGHEIVLNTYRSECNNGTIEAALDLINERHWMCLKSKNAEFDFEIQRIYPTFSKIQPQPFNIDEYIGNGVIFIDDQSRDVPLKKACMTQGMMVDWDALDKIFEEKGLYNKIN